MVELSRSRLTGKSRRPSRIGSAVLVLSGAALFGTIGTAQALGPETAVPQLSAVRLLLGGGVLTLIALVTGPSVRLLATARQSPPWWAGVSQVGFNLCFFSAVREAGVAVGTLVAIGATPILTGLVTRQVSRLWGVATAIAVTGLALLVGGELTTTSPPTPLGLLLALGAAACYATYIIAGNAAARRGLDTQAHLAVAFSIAGIVCVPFLFTGEIGWLGSRGGLALVGYLSLCTTVLAYSLFNRGLQGIRASTASTLGLVEPVVAAGLAYVLLEETLGATGLLGAALILLGLLLLVRSVGDGDGDCVESSTVGENAARA